MNLRGLYRAIQFKLLRYKRADLKLWLELDGIKSDYLTEAVKGRDSELVGKAIALYLSTALGHDEDFWLSLPWAQTLEAFFKVEQVNLPRKPIQRYFD